MDPLVLMMLMGQQSGSAQPTGTFGLAMAYQQQQLMSSTMNKSVVASAVNGRVSNVERVVSQRQPGGKFEKVSDTVFNDLLAQAKLDDAAFNRVMYS